MVEDHPQPMPPCFTAGDTLDGMAVSLGAAFRAVELLDGPRGPGDDETERMLADYADSVLNRATFHRATGPLGAFVQLLSMKAQWEEIEQLAGADEGRVQLLGDRFRRLLYSLAAHFEAAGGFDRRDFAFDHSMPARLDRVALSTGVAFG